MREETARVINIFVIYHAYCLDFDKVNHLHTFLVYYFPLLCSSRRLVEDGESERPTVLGSIQILCSDIHVRGIFADTLDWLHQRGAIVIAVFNSDNDGARDGFLRMILKINRRAFRILSLWLTTGQSGKDRVLTAEGCSHPGWVSDSNQF